METDKQLAAIALFRELYTANQDAYGVLAKLITYAAHKTTHYCNSIEEIKELLAHLQSSVFKLSKDLIDSIHEEGIVAYTS